MQNRNRWLNGILFGLFLAVSVGNRAAAQAPSFTQREVTFHNRSVELHGTLMLPASQGRFPAVVFLHGSGPTTRQGARSYAEEFARLGVASVFFDKRGSGSSTGSWITASLDDLVEDALAAVQFAKTDEHIDPARIGFWGVSQAGWIATVAAARSQDVAFMILISGGGASPRESEMFSYRQAFDQLRLSEAEKAVGFEVVDQYFHYLATGDSRPALAARLKELETNRESKLHLLGEQLDQILPSLENRPQWKWVANYDPGPDTAKVKCPVLLLFGDRDSDHPTELAVKGWREGLAKAGNHDVTLMIFPGAGHGIRMREGFSGPGRPPFADGYKEVMLGWLWHHVVEKIADAKDQVGKR